MNVRHLKIGPNAVVTMRESQWRALLKRTTGHVIIGANAKVRIVPEQIPRKRG